MHNAFLAAGYDLSPAQQATFRSLLRAFRETNAHTNLSAIRDEEGIVTKHFVDSLAVLRLPAFAAAQTVLDLGTGGGFPGLPLAIMAPEKRFILLDATRKKVQAVQSFIQTLDLKNAEAVWGRAEDAALRSRLGTFDIVVSRAVAFLPDLLAFSAPYLRPGGTFVAYKLPSDEERGAGLQAARRLRLHAAPTVSYRLPDDEQERSLLPFVRN